MTTTPMNDPHLPVTDDAADGKPKRPWRKPEIRRMRVNFTESGPTFSDNANENLRYSPSP